jgi:FKBP-type peptidyl-prolyl cis-trans isomerase FklB
MKLQILTLAVLSAVSFAGFAQQTQPASQQSQPANPPQTTTAQPSTQQAFSNQTDKVSYAIGVDIGSNFKKQNIDLNPDVLAKGVKDGLSGGKTMMDDKEMRDTLMNFQKELMAKRQAQMQEMVQKNKAEGETFLAENKKKPGIITLPDGLQYKIVKAGSGVSPTDTDSVTVNYEGTFPNGKEFDSSYKRGKPATFPVTQVIPAWTEALKMMKPGAEWMIYVPASLGYGERGAGPIGPNQVLVFKIELISVQKASEAIAPAASAAKQ